MPRPRHAQGRPDTRVIPADWNTTHAPVVRKSARGTVALREPGTQQAWSETEGQMVQVPIPAYYTGGCRAQALSGEARVSVAVGDARVVADYLIVVDLDTTVDEGHLATLTGTGDPSLDGLVLQVLQAARGTERWERDLFCTLLTPAT